MKYIAIIYLSIAFMPTAYASNPGKDNVVIFAANGFPNIACQADCTRNFASCNGYCNNGSNGTIGSKARSACAHNCVKLYGPACQKQCDQ
jgi:hypothetical protein